MIYWDIKSGANKLTQSEKISELNTEICEMEGTERKRGREKNGGGEMKGENVPFGYVLNNSIVITLKAHQLSRSRRKIQFP